MSMFTPTNTYMAAMQGVPPTAALIAASESKILELQGKLATLVDLYNKMVANGNSAAVSVKSQIDIINSMIAQEYEKIKQTQTMEPYYNIKQKDTDAFTWRWLNETGISFLDFAALKGGYVYSPEWKTPFSPFNGQPLASADNILLLFMLLKLSKEPKLLKELAETYMKTQTDIIESIADMGNQSWIHNSNATMLIAAVLHSRGLLSNVGLVRTQEHCRGLSDAIWQKDVALGALTGLSTLVKGTASTLKAMGAGEK